MTTNANITLEKITGGRLTFGRALSAIRQCEEITQISLARSLEVSRQYLCDIEHGRTNVSIKQAAQIANALNHPPEIFIELAVQDAVENAGLHFIVKVAKNFEDARAA